MTSLVDWNSREYAALFQTLNPDPEVYLHAVGFEFNGDCYGHLRGRGWSSLVDL